MAKKHPEVKMSSDAIANASLAIRSTVLHFDTLEQEAAKRNSMALHEIRKLNRTVKQTAERLCAGERPDAPDAANPQLVQIWKSAELMSHQFDVIEVLANESLLQLPLNGTSEVYRLFDKCVRIYSPPGMVSRLALRAPPGYSGRIRACDKTLSIIPSVLIENALKYSVPNSTVQIELSPISGKCSIRVSNRALGLARLTDAVFKKCDSPGLSDTGGAEDYAAIAGA